MSSEKPKTVELECISPHRYGTELRAVGKRYEYPESAASKLLNPDYPAEGKGPLCRKIKK